MNTLLWLLTNVSLGRHQREHVPHGLFFGEKKSCCKSSMLEESTKAGLLPPSTHIQLIRLLLSYKCTLSLQDEKILRLIARNEKEGNSVPLSSPILFGSSLASIIRSTASNCPVAGAESVNGKKRKKKKPINPNSITDEEIEKYLLSHHGKEPYFFQVFSSLDRVKLEQTILKFPHHLALNARKKVKNQLVRGERDICYSNEGRSSFLDPRFVLVELWHLVSPGIMLNCHDFIHSKALSLVIASLSSEHESIRSVSYSILQRFYRQLESSSKFYLEAPYWLWFLDSFRSYLVIEQNFRLQPLVTVFISCSLGVLTDPTHVLFGSIREFFSKNFPKISSKLVASKLKELLHSTNALHYKIHFDFATKVLEYGLIDEDDFQAVHSHLIFDWMMLMVHSKVTLEQEIVQLLRIFNSAISISLSCVQVLCLQCNLLSFILQVTLKQDQRVREKGMKASSGENGHKKKKTKTPESQNTSKSEPNEIINQLNYLVESILYQFRANNDDVNDQFHDLNGTNYIPSVKSILASLQLLRFSIYRDEVQEK